MHKFYSNPSEIDPGDPLKNRNQHCKIETLAKKKRTKGHYRIETYCVDAWDFYSIETTLESGGNAMDRFYRNLAFCILSPSRIMSNTLVHTPPETRQATSHHNTSHPWHYTIKHHQRPPKNTNPIGDTGATLYDTLHNICYQELPATPWTAPSATPSSHTPLPNTTIYHQQHVHLPQHAFQPPPTTPQHPPRHLTPFRHPAPPSTLPTAAQEHRPQRLPATSVSRRPQKHAPPIAPAQQPPAPGSANPHPYTHQRTPCPTAPQNESTKSANPHPYTWSKNS